MGPMRGDPEQLDRPQRVPDPAAKGLGTLPGSGGCRAAGALRRRAAVSPRQASGSPVLGACAAEMVQVRVGRTHPWHSDWSRGWGKTAHSKHPGTGTHITTKTQLCASAQKGPGLACKAGSPQTNPTRVQQNISLMGDMRRATPGPSKPMPKPHTCRQRGLLYMLEAVACIRPAAAGLRVLAQVRVRALQRLPAPSRAPSAPASLRNRSAQRRHHAGPCAWMPGAIQQARMSKAQLPLGRLARVRARHPLSNVATGQPLNPVLLCAPQPSLFRALRPYFSTGSASLIRICKHVR